MTDEGPETEVEQPLVRVVIVVDGGVVQDVVTDRPGVTFTVLDRDNARVGEGIDGFDEFVPVEVDESLQCLKAFRDEFIEKET